MATTTQLPFDAPPGDRLALMLFFATALHALVILGISFDALDNNKPDADTPTLDITVVDPAKTAPPKDYDYLADTSQDGAGNTDEKIQPQQQSRAETPPPPLTSSAPDNTRILTRDSSELKTPDPEQAQQEPEARPDAAALMSRTMEMVSLNQQINQNMQAYSKSSKSKFVSARTREFKYASYMRDWVAKVERVGELNYPDAARRQNLSGKLIVQVAIYPDGSVREITIRTPSGHKLLDDAAVRIVKLAAPFAPFPDDIKKETDILYITRTWVFTSGNRLQTD